MPSPETGSPVVRFGDFELDLRSGELATNGHRVLLADQPFRLLALLIRERGNVVSREDLRRELWSDDTFVDFELSLNAAVRRLRETLGDSATTPRFIQTLPRRGYRFIADVAAPGLAVEALTHQPPVAEIPGSAPPIAEAATSPASGTRRRIAWWGLALAGAAVAGALALRTVLERPASVVPAAGAGAPRISAITTEGTVRMASLSPDGTQVAYVCMNGTQESLWLRQVGATAALQLVGPADGTFRSLSFGPGGFVYYSFFSPDRSNVPLYRVSTRGGEPAVMSHVAGGVSFSPDGTQFAYVSSVSMGLRESRVIVEDVNGGAPRVLAARTPPASYVRTSPAWSPDGRRLVVVAMDDRRPLAPALVAIDVRDARERPIATLDVEVIDAVLWPRDAAGARLVLSARERRAKPLRLWDVSVATGQRRPLTGDASDYLLTGLARDGQRAVAVRTSTEWSLWVAPIVNASAAAREVAKGAGAFDLLEGVAWTSAGQLVYAGVESGNLDLWRLDPETGARARLTSDPAEDFHPAVSPDGRTVVFASTRSGTSAIWATPIDEERPRRLSAGGDRWPSWSPDGRWVVFQRGLADTAIEAVWRVPVDGGDAERIGPPHSYRPVVSPDARSVAHYWMNPEQWALAITRIGSALPARALPIARTHGNRVVRWSPDGSALAFIDGVGGVANIWLQPIDGGPARRLTDFPNGTIETFDWSRDGSRLAWIRLRQTGDVVAVELAR